MRAGVVGREENVFAARRASARLLSAGWAGLRVSSPPQRSASLPPDASACSTASASRERTPASFFSRSMTISMLCLMRRSSFRSSVRRTTWPSTRARTKPRLSMSAKRSLYSPFCPRMTGARTRKRVPSGRARMRAMICSRDLGGDRPAALRDSGPGRCGHRARADSRKSR